MKFGTVKQGKTHKQDKRIKQGEKFLASMQAPNLQGSLK